MNAIYQFPTREHFFSWIKKTNDEMQGLTDDEKKQIHFEFSGTFGAPCAVHIQSERIKSRIENEIETIGQNSLYNILKLEKTELSLHSMSLEESFGKARLQRHDSPDSAYLILEKKSGSGTFKDVLDKALSLSGWKFSFVELVSAGGIPFRGLRLNRQSFNQSRHPLPHFFGVQVYTLDSFGQDSSHWLPPGYSHPILRHYPFLAPMCGEGFWKLWHGDPLNGSFTEYQLANPDSEAQGIEHVLEFNADDLFKTPLDQASYSIPADDELDLKIPIDLVPDSNLIDRFDSTSLGGVMISIQTKKHHFPPALFDVLDRIDCGIDDAWYYATQKNPEHREADRLVRHLVRIDHPRVENIRELIPIDARAFYQPASFKKHSINLFIPFGQRFKPDITKFLGQLPPDHPLVKQMSELAGGEHPKDPTHYLEKDGDRHFKVRSVDGGRSLLECLKGVVSTLTETSDLLKDEWVEHASIKSRERTEFVTKAISIETDSMGKTFDELLAAFRLDLGPMSEQFNSVQQKIQSLTLILKELEDGVSQVPTRWKDFVGKVLELLNEISEPRLQWIQKEESRLDDESRMVELVKGMNVNTKKLIEKRAKTLTGSIDTVRDLSVEADALTESLQLHVENVTPFAESVETANTLARNSLELWNERMEETLSLLKLRRESLIDRQGELQLRQKQQDTESRDLDDFEQTNEELEEQLIREKNELDTRRSSANKEIKRLENIRDIKLPLQIKRVTELEEKFLEINSKGYESSLRSQKELEVDFESQISNALDTQQKLSDFEESNKKKKKILEFEITEIESLESKVQGEVRRIEMIRDSMPDKKKNLATLQSKLKSMEPEKIESQFDSVKIMNDQLASQVDEATSVNVHLSDELAAHEALKKEVKALERKNKNLHSTSKIESETVDDLYVRTLAVVDKLKGAGARPLRKKGLLKRIFFGRAR